jgi:hypothetical protein
MPSNNIKPVIRNQARPIWPSLFCIFPSFDIFSLNKRLTTPLSVSSIHFKQSSVSWAEQALRKVTPTARHQESVLLYDTNLGNKCTFDLICSGMVEHKPINAVISQ